MKNSKLKQKLVVERKLAKLLMCFLVVSWTFTVMFCFIFLRKSKCDM